MKRIWSILFMSMLTILLTLPIVSSSDVGIATIRHTIEISISDNGLLVIENININNTGDTNATTLKFWIQQDATDVEILAVESGATLSSTVLGNVRESNLSEQDISILPDSSYDIRVTYTLPSDTERYEKTLSYPTTVLEVTFDDRDLYHVEKAQATSSFSLILYRPTEAPLNLTYLIVIFILVVILIASTLLFLRKQRTKEKRKIMESEETLTTKKTLLLSLLKDLEKQHRSKSISDETYHKLKDEYKHQAVDAMKKLEDYKK